MKLDHNNIEIQQLPLHERNKLEQGLCPKCGNGRFVTSSPIKGVGYHPGDDVFVCIECKYILGAESFQPRRIVSQSRKTQGYPQEQRSKINETYDPNQGGNEKLSKSVIIPMAVIALMIIAQVSFVIALRDIEHNVEHNTVASGVIHVSLDQMEYTPTVPKDDPELPEADIPYDVTIYEDYPDEYEHIAEVHSILVIDEYAAMPEVPSSPLIPLERNSPYNNEDYVMKMQMRLNDIGAYRDNELEIDGRFGPLTQAAVMYFQGLIGVVEDGIVDGELWNKLFLWEEYTE